MREKKNDRERLIRVKERARESETETDGPNERYYKKGQKWEGGGRRA